MKFIVDAQLPFQLALFIQRKGFDALHTNDLPNKNVLPMIILGSWLKEITGLLLQKIPILLILLCYNRFLKNCY